MKEEGEEGEVLGKEEEEEERKHLPDLRPEILIQSERGGGRGGGKSVRMG